MPHRPVGQFHVQVSAIVTVNVLEGSGFYSKPNMPFLRYGTCALLKTAKYDFHRTSGIWKEHPWKNWVWTYAVALIIFLQVCYAHEKSSACGSSPKQKDYAGVSLCSIALEHIGMYSRVTLHKKGVVFYAEYAVDRIPLYFALRWCICGHQPLPGKRYICCRIARGSPS